MDVIRILQLYYIKNARRLARVEVVRLPFRIQITLALNARAFDDLF